MCPWDDFGMAILYGTTGEVRITCPARTGGGPQPVGLGSLAREAAPAYMLVHPVAQEGAYDR